MTDKEKQIEEMAREFEKYCEEKATNTCGSNCHYCTAEIMFNLGYRKIPEGSVVISKQVWEEHIEKREKANKIFEERIRKETAREILQVIKKAKENGQIYYNDAFMITAQGAYGVEVEE